MNILIKDIFGKERPMPQDGYIDIRLHFYSGRIESATMQTGTSPFYAMFKVVEVPPHGRLIDADFEEQHYTSMTTNPTPDVTEQDKRNSLIIIEALQMAKTVIEAED
jgi:hypothetical protein